MTRPVINESQLRQVRRAIREAELPPAKARKLLVRIAKIRPDTGCTTQCESTANTGGGSLGTTKKTG